MALLPGDCRSRTAQEPLSCLPCSPCPAPAPPRRAPGADPGHIQLQPAQRGRQPGQVRRLQQVGLQHQRVQPRQPAQRRQVEPCGAAAQQQTAQPGACGGQRGAQLPAGQPAVHRQLLQAAGLQVLESPGLHRGVHGERGVPPAGRAGGHLKVQRAAGLALQQASHGGGLRLQRGRQRRTLVGPHAPEAPAAASGCSVQLATLRRPCAHAHPQRHRLPLLLWSLPMVLEVLMLLMVPMLLCAQPGQQALRRQQKVRLPQGGRRFCRL